MPRRVERCGEGKMPAQGYWETEGARGKYKPQRPAPSDLIPPATPYLPTVITKHNGPFKLLIHQMG